MEECFGAVERVAAVDKIEGKRKPEDFIGHRNRGAMGESHTFSPGSDATAARGRKREQSEWPWSAENEPAMSGEVFAGNRNRIESMQRAAENLS